MKTTSPILGPSGQPFQHTKPRDQVSQALERIESQRRRAVHGRYDAASSSTEFANYWAGADALDADSANSKSVRHTLVKRSRYETANNGYVDGIVQTLATDIVSTGPKLRLRTRNKQFNQAVETVWLAWSKAVQLRRKLWCMAHAKIQDGEAFAVLRDNQRLRHAVKLDLVLIECDQVTSNYGSPLSPGRIDGVAFDEFGNVLYYEVLKHHPGGQFGGTTPVTEQVPDRFMCHWYLLRRPGQHRGVPELRSTMQVGAASRRWREATIAAAETAADISVWLETNMPPDGDADPVAPMAEMEFRKRMAIAAPMGWSAKQVKAEHPNATYEAFNKAQIAELGRPKGMPYNRAACDNTGNSFSGGKLDQIGYYSQLDVEREDCSDLVLDKLFDQFWREAVLAYDWNADPDVVPVHTWDYPQHPVADEVASAQATDIRLKNGTLTLSALYSQQGEDFEDELTQAAEDFGIDEQSMRQVYQHAILNAQNQQASMAQAENQASKAPAPAPQQPATQEVPNAQ